MIKQKLGEELDGWIHTAFPFLFVREPSKLRVFMAQEGSLSLARIPGGGTTYETSVEGSLTFVEMSTSGVSSVRC